MTANNQDLFLTPGVVTVNNLIILGVSNVK
jgi:hypothetical protein